MKEQKHFAARLFAAPELGQIGPSEKHRVVFAGSLSAAKRTAKYFAITQDWRLVDVFELQPEEREEFKRNGWYSNTINA
jgi:hypothetical protein